MARTAPAPNIPAIPGMNPGIFIMGGGGGSGGSGGKRGGAGKGQQGASSGSGGNEASGGGKNALSSGSCGGSGGCPGNHPGNEGSVAKGDPVDVASGRAFTEPALDLRLPGPLPLNLTRAYSSAARSRDTGLGHGWSHSLGWTIDVHRTRIEVWTGSGGVVVFPVLPIGAQTLGPKGWVLRREPWGFAIDAGDDLWRIFSVTEADGKRYRLSAIDDRNRNRIALSYEAGRLVEIADSAGRRVRVTSTPEGRIESLQAKNAWAQGRWVVFAHYKYDAAGDLVSVKDADGHTTTFTYEDHLLTSRRSPTGLTFFYRYDSRGRCVETWGEYPGRRDPSLDNAVPPLLADRTTQARGVFHVKLDFLDDGYVEVADSRTVHRYFVNEQGMLERSVSGGGVHSRTYDGSGHVTSYTDPRGAITRWKRDERGREVAISDPLGRQTILDRNAAGWVCEIMDPAGYTTRFDRDAKGNVVMVANPAGGVSAFEYDERGLIVAEIAPNGARTSYSYDEHGNCTGVLLPNGATYRFAYDPLGRLISCTNPLGGAAYYVWSDGARLLSLRDHDGGTVRYDYDAIGNILETGIGAAERRYGQGNLLTQRGDKHYRYDADGRLVEARRSEGSHDVEVWRYAWNAKGLLRSVRRPDGVVVEFSYDPLGRRIEKRVSRPAVCGGLEAIESTRFTWDGDVLLRTLRTDLRDGRSWKRTFVFEDDRFIPMGHRDGDPGSGDWSWYVNDPSGAPLALVRGDGRAACTIERSAWGRDCGSSQSHLTPLSFQGQYIDEETGLSYNRFRYYDPETGQYISPDALGLAGGFNEYAYVKNPVRLVDPLGLAPSAADMARQKADELNAQPGKKPNCVTAVVDKSTGKVYYGTPGDPGLDMGTAPSPLKENAAKLPPEGIAPHKQTPGNCGEPKAVDAALKSGAKLENLEMHTVFIGGKRHGQAKTRCPNCQVTTAGVATTSD